jgi:hypothetical protein
VPRFLGVLAAMALVITSRFASARPLRLAPLPPLPPPSPLSESLRGDARGAYLAATALLDAGDGANALAKYGQAYDLSHDPRLLFDMAICDRDLRAYARMQGLLLRYVREAEGTLTPEQREEIDAALAAIRALVGTVKLAVTEPGAEVRVDAETVGSTPLAGSFTVDAGRHTLRVTKPGFDPLEQAIDVPGGNEATVRVALVNIPHPPLWLWIVGAAAVAAGAVAFGYFLFERDDRQSTNLGTVTMPR